MPCCGQPTQNLEWHHQPEVVNEYISGLEEAARSKHEYPGGEGDGILTVGGGKYWPGIAVSIRMARSRGWRGPIQVWYQGVSEPVRPADVVGLDVEFIDITKLSDPPKVIAGWPNKLSAIARCPFERILFLDADAYVVADPTPLFPLADHPSGFAHWEDMPNQASSIKWPHVWPHAKMHPPVPPIQGGQLVINRRTAWRQIAIADWICQRSEYFFRHMFGDQDSWRVAFEATAVRPMSLGRAGWQDVAFVCVHDQKAKVVHRCQGKLYDHAHIDPSRRGNESSPKYVLPCEAEVFSHLAAVLGDGGGAERVFGTIYNRGLWGGTSGVGSEPAEARPYVQIINGLIDLCGVRSVVDLGCGDGRIAERIQVQSYTGIDVHAPLLAGKSRPENGRTFAALDFYKDRDRIPAAEWLLCKDVLHHWPNAWVVEFLKWALAAKRWKRIVLTQDVHQQGDWIDCHLGGYRALHPHQEPLRQFGLKVFAEYLHKAILYT